MNQQIVRVTDQVRIVNGKKNPSARYGFQKCGLDAGGGMFETFDKMFSPDRGETHMPPGDYAVVPGNAYIDARGNLRIGVNFEPVKASKAA